MAETLPWASGKRKPAPGGRPTARRPRRRSKTSVMSIVWAVVTLALGTALLIVQGTLLLIFTALSVLVTALSVYVDQKAERDTLPPPTPIRRAAAPSPGKAQNKAAAGSNVKCTKTGRPTDVCPCPEKHVITSRGAQRFKLAVGAPIPGSNGQKKKPKVKVVKEPRIPTTNHAKPTRQVPGERMRRVQ